MTINMYIGAWTARIIMLISIIVQNTKIADIAIRYLSESSYAESAVQASQVSGELLLVSMLELGDLIVSIVIWVMVELFVREVNKIKVAREAKKVVKVSLSGS